MTTHPVDPSTTTDCSLLAKVPLPPGVDSAGPWRTDRAGHLLRDLSDGRVQHGDGEAVAACRHCVTRDDGQVQLAAGQLSDGDATIPTMTTTEEVALPTGATSAEDYDPEDDTRAVRADITTGTLATQVWALQDRNGQLTEVDILLGGVCEQGYSATQIRQLVPVLLRAADLADQWTGQPIADPTDNRLTLIAEAHHHSQAAVKAMEALRPHLSERGQFIADIAAVAAQGIEKLR